MNKPLVSVVVPMYNVEPYLRVCVDSLLNQTLHDIEILLVDDGSPDKCGEIAEQYAQQDKRVRVFHQSNAGLGPARNTGIAHAFGEYVGFVDSDDWVRPKMFERLYTAAKRTHADIAVGGHRDMANGKLRIAKPHPLAGRTISGHDQVFAVRNRLFGHGPADTEAESFPMRVWTAIYNVELLESNGLRFEEILSEDTVFNLSAYYAARSITFTEDTDYCYRMDDQPSIMHTFSPDTLGRYEAFITRLRQIAESEIEQRDECITRVSRMAVDYCRLYAGMVANSNLSVREKLRYLRELSYCDMAVLYSAGYPISALPTQQRIFHEALLKHKTGRMLFLLQVRSVLKKRVWK